MKSSIKFIFILTIAFFSSSCSIEDKGKSKTFGIEGNNDVVPQKLNIDFIKKNTLGVKGEYDLSKIDFSKLRRVDSLTLSLLPGGYRQTSGEDYLYFNDLIEHNDFQLLTVIEGNQFGNFLNIFQISKEDKIVLADTSVVLNGAEDTWTGKSRGVWNNGKYRFEQINQVDSAGYSEFEYTKRIDTIKFELIPRTGKFEKKILTSIRFEEIVKSKKKE